MGNFELVQEQLHLGDALGNRFEITLRRATAAAALQPIPSHPITPLLLRCMQCPPRYFACLRC